MHAAQTSRPNSYYWSDEDAATSDRRLETGDRRQETGDWRLVTGDLL